MSLPSIVYHYCPPAALLEILRTGRVWLTHQSGLNDLRDTTWAVPFIREAIKVRRSDSSQRFFTELTQFYDLNRQDVYIASFSSDGDVLSQWRAYGMDGEGFAIGFRSASFDASLRAPVTSTVPQHTVGFLEIQYDDELLKRSIAQILDEHLSLPGGGGDVHECGMRLRAVSLSFKNPAFQEEDEWRLTYSPLITTHRVKKDIQIIGMLSDLRFRPSRYGVLSYFEMPFAPVDRRSAIAELIVGPKNRSQDDTLTTMFRCLGYTDAEVKRSKASYR